MRERKRMTVIWVAAFTIFLAAVSLIAAVRVRALRINTSVIPGQSQETTDPGSVTDPAVWRTENAGGLGMPQQADWEEQGL